MVEYHVYAGEGNYFPAHGRSRRHRRALQVKGGIQCAPGKRDGAGAAIFRPFADSRVTGAGKFAFKRT